MFDFALQPLTRGAISWQAAIRKKIQTAELKQQKRTAALENAPSGQARKKKRRVTPAKPRAAPAPHQREKALPITSVVTAIPQTLTDPSTALGAPSHILPVGRAFDQSMLTGGPAYVRAPHSSFIQQGHLAQAPCSGQIAAHLDINSAVEQHAATGESGEGHVVAASCVSDMTGGPDGGAVSAGTADVQASGVRAGGIPAPKISSSMHPLPSHMLLHNHGLELHFAQHQNTAPNLLVHDTQNLQRLLQLPPAPRIGKPRSSAVVLPMQNFNNGSSSQAPSMLGAGMGMGMGMGTIYNQNQSSFGAVEMALRPSWLAAAAPVRCGPPAVSRHATPTTGANSEPSLLVHWPPLTAVVADGDSKSPAPAPAPDASRPASSTV